MNKPTVRAVYPAYHPAFHAQCKDCKKNIWSSVVLATDVPNQYICSRCAFVYYFIDSTPLFHERDMRELKEYGNLWQN
ncbi:hypothetical protein PHYNN_165 [Pantoea phage Phynn]|nr:hypothetical protein PHYNN_165 [Pantoea phage Phynn]